jgi:3-methyl-2-oxobutanoate hydroxymethyltransferase
MKERGEKITCLTAYDYPTARILDAAGIELILVGDSAANVIYGYATTLLIGMAEMACHTKAVAAGAKRAMLVADMPFMSYQPSIEIAVENAGVLMKAGAEAVKLEGAGPILPAIERLVAFGIPVMGHLGLTPQSVYQFGGHKLQGRTAAAQKQLLADAKRLERAGCFAIVLEKIPRDFAGQLSHSISIPTIGIGAGPQCDGQVLVLHDIIGLSDQKLRFVKRYAEVGDVIRRAVDCYREEVRTGKFPDDEHSYIEGNPNS